MKLTGKQKVIGGIVIKGNHIFLAQKLFRAKQEYSPPVLALMLANGPTLCVEDHVLCGYDEDNFCQQPAKRFDQSIQSISNLVDY